MSIVSFPVVSASPVEKKITSAADFGKQRPAFAFCTYYARRWGVLRRRGRARQTRGVLMAQREGAQIIAHVVSLEEGYDLHEAKEEICLLSGGTCLFFQIASRAKKERRSRTSTGRNVPPKSPRDPAVAPDRWPGLPIHGATPLPKYQSCFSFRPSCLSDKTLLFKGYSRASFFGLAKESTYV